MSRVYPDLSPNDGWDRLQPPCDPTVGLRGDKKWMEEEPNLSPFASN